MKSKKFTTPMMFQIFIDICSNIYFEDLGLFYLKIALKDEQKKKKLFASKIYKINFEKLIN